MLEILRKRLPSAGTLTRVIENLFRDEVEKKPLVVAWYPDCRCNLKCPHCSQSGNTRGARNSAPASLAQQYRDLGMIRQDCPNIYFLV
ncbi:hypothetical protein HZA43_04400 [Candidatus Peregrinibacteria bacterium]|nr:hypothetical protein [Candidatus Peregrinibacteria bacterium]